MSIRSFADYLSGVGEASLTALLQARPDVLVEPVPRGFSQLAQRLGGAESLATALSTANRDTVIVGQAVAALGSSATVPALALLLGASEPAVRNGVAELCGRGLAWDSSGIVVLLERLEAHWLAEIGGGRPVAKIAGSVLAENLRAAVGAFGPVEDGLRKADLTARLSAIMADLPLLAKVITELPKPAKDRLGEYRRGYSDYYSGYGRARPRGAGHRDPTELLIAAGLLLPVNYGLELPREVAVAAWLVERELTLTGRPEIPPASADELAVRRAATAAAQEALRAVTILLDEACA
ncbi:MAG: helicase-associated domain-containing protein, partial [Pseudonocardiaceae bacterium]